MYHLTVFVHEINHNHFQNSNIETKEEIIIFLMIYVAVSAVCAEFSPHMFQCVMMIYFAVTGCRGTLLNGGPQSHASDKKACRNGAEYGLFVGRCLLFLYIPYFAVSKSVFVKLKKKKISFFSKKSILFASFALVVNAYQ